MPEFAKDFNAEDALNSFRKSLKYYPIELQLVWLFEMLVIIAYTKASEDGSSLIGFNKRSGNYVLTQSKTRVIISSILASDKILKLLETFRNYYVHKGPDQAYKFYKDVFTKSNRRNEMNKLADLAGVTLNWNCSLYEILDVKASSN